MAISRKISHENQGNIFKDLIFVYKPYWPLFLILFTVGIIGSYIYLRLATPVYETTTKILIKDEKKGVEEAKTVESLDGFSGKKIIENEVEVLQSPALIDEVVTALQLYAPVYKKLSYKTISGYRASPIKVAVDNTDSIVKAQRIAFTFDKNGVTIDKHQYPLNEFVRTFYGTLKFTINPLFKNYKDNTSGSFYFDIVPVKNISNQVNASLKVEGANKLSSIIYLKYRDEVPERAEDILNSLLAAYNRASLNDKNDLSANTLKFIDERLALLKSDLDAIELKTQSYRASSNAVDISTQGKLFLQNVSNNDQKLGDINMQLAALNQVGKYVTSQNGSGGIVPSTLGVNDPTLTVLVNKLYSTELEYEAIKKNTGENNPNAVSLRDQISKLRPDIIANIENNRKALEVSRNTLASTNTSFNSTLRAMPEKERQLIEINREQGTKNGIYNFLLQKREETALSHASTVANNRIIDKARTSDSPVSPKGKVTYLISLIIALFIAIAIVATKERLRGKIMFVRDIEELTAYPVVGEIMSSAAGSPIVVGEGVRTIIAEQFRKIRVSLSFLGISKTHKRVLVTSSISGEGKSFVASNLALSLAITGQKVALLDFDLINPTLNKRLTDNHQKGITEFLSDQCTAEEIINQTDLHDNLYLLSAGSLPPNPSELIMSGRTKELLNYLEKKFDYIIIDVAPVGPVTDAYLLSPLCDATLYIVRHNYTPKVFVERIDESNKIHNLKNIAIVFNGISSRGFGIKNYSYGYQRPNSYGYVYSEKQQKFLNAKKSD